MLFWELFRKLIFSRRANSLVRRISIITVVGIGLSLASFLLVLFVMNAMNDKTKRRVVSLEPHLIIQKTDGSEVSMDDPIWEKIKSVQNAEGFLFESQDIILRTADGQIRGAIARGIDQKSFIHLLNNVEVLRSEKESKAQKDIISDKQIYKNPLSIQIPNEEEVILGVDLSRVLGVFEEDRIMLIAPEALLLTPSEAPPFKRVKILRTLTTDLPDIDSKVLYYKRGSLNRSQMMAKSVKYGIEVYFADPDLVKDYKVKWSAPEYQIETWQERNSDLFRALVTEKIMIGLILILAALIAGAAIVTVMTLLISQKRSDIAVLKTIGLSNRKSEKTFVRIGFLLSMVGAVGGVIIGTGLSLYLQFHPLNILPQEVYYDAQIDALVEPWLVFFVLIMALIFSYAGAYISTREVSSIEPFEILKSQR